MIDPSAAPSPGAVPAPVGGFELPGARQVVGRGFELMIAATAEIRRTSLYFGGLLVAVVGPLVVLGVAVLATAPGDLGDLGAAFGSIGRPGAANAPEAAGWRTATTLLALGLYPALAGAFLVSVESGNVGIAILAGRRLGRRVGLREALIRSRQVFWRVAVAGALVAIPVTIAQWLIAAIVATIGLRDEGSTLVALLASTALAAPFGYAATGIVLGDVDAMEALRRSVGLFRARPWLGLVIAFFPAIFGSIQLLALSAGGEVIVRVAEVVGLGFNTDGLHSGITLVVVLAAIAAVGSLLFTVGALFAAPQVVAFLGLTHYAGGLDRAASPEPGAAPDAPSPAASAGLPPPGPPPSVLPAGRGPSADDARWRALIGPPTLALSGLPHPSRLGTAATGTTLAGPALAGRPPAAPGPGQPTAGWRGRRDPARAFHWVTWPAIVGIALGVLAAAAGLANLADRL